MAFTWKDMKQYGLTIFAEWACKSFAANFGDVIHYKDITKIDPYTDTTIPECDIVLGGFLVSGLLYYLETARSERHPWRSVQTFCRIC